MYVDGRPEYQPRPLVSKRGLFKTEEYLEAMIEKRKFLPIAAIAAVALTVSACGGGGDSMSIMDMDKDETTTGPSVADLFATAQESRTDADAAAAAAAAAVETALETAGEFTTSSVAGDSMTATMNAQAILDADAAAKQAVTDAEDALAAAETAKTAAEALDDANAHKTSLLAALDEAIMVAEAQIEAATESRDSEDLADVVETVTGDDEDMLKSAAYHGKAVAMAVGEALGAMTAERGIARGMIAGAIAGVPDTAVMMDDHQGKTWAEIVGADMEARIGAEFTVVKIASIDGLSATAVAALIAGDSDGFVDGDEFETAFYKGIPETPIALATSVRWTKTVISPTAGTSRRMLRWRFT